MEIKEIKLADIKPYENNPRFNDEAVDAVAESIQQFGFKVPIVIDKNGVIVTGHTRYKAAKAMSMDKVPCILADDLTEDQVKAFRIADNKVGEIATWDFGKLEEELASLGDIDMSEFGFDIDLTDYSKGKSEDEEEDPFDDIEKLEKHYGVPYQGNKSRIADIIINILPAGKRLVDLFGGGVRLHTVQCFQGSGSRNYITT